MEGGGEGVEVGESTGGGGEGCEEGEEGEEGDGVVVDVHCGVGFFYSQGGLGVMSAVLGIGIGGLCVFIKFVL